MQNFTCFSFGFISGFLLLITGGTLNFWLASEGTSTNIVSIFSLVSIPYALNFLWAPFLDRFNINILPNINRKFSILLVLYILGAIIVYILSYTNPIKNPINIGIFTFTLSFINTTQDLVLNGLRTEIIPTKDQAKTSGIYIFGYRIGMILSGSAAVYISDFIEMNIVYKIFSLFYLIFIFLTFYILKNNSSHSKTKSYPNSEKFSFQKLFGFFGDYKIFIYFLVFLMFYRLADNFIIIMLNPFLLEIGFSTKEIALAGKFCGVSGSAIGGICASFYMKNKSLVNSLIVFAIIHSISHISYIFVYYYPQTEMLILATLFESITGGMTMAAYIALISLMCHGKYRATQYAIFSAMMGVSRAILPTFSGAIATTIGWSSFFLLSSILVIPSLLLLNKIQQIVNIRANGSFNN